MTEQNTGGFAFPAPHFDLSDHEHGMTLRDYFAAKAMQGMFSSEIWPQEKDMPYMARLSYAMADAMLEARK